MCAMERPLMCSLCDDTVALVVSFAGPRGAPAEALLSASRRLFAAVICHRGAFLGPVQAAWREAFERDLAGEDVEAEVLALALWRHSHVLVRHLEVLKALNAWLALQSRRGAETADLDSGEAAQRAHFTRLEAAELRRRAAVVGAASGKFRARLRLGGAEGELQGGGLATWADVTARAVAAARWPEQGHSRRALPVTPTMNQLRASAAAARRTSRGCPRAAGNSPRVAAPLRPAENIKKSRRSRAAWRWAAELLRGDGSLTALCTRAEVLEGKRLGVDPCIAGA